MNLRLLMISSEFPPGPGGIGTHAYYLARHLAQRAWDVAVLTPQHYVIDGDVEAFNRSQAFPVVRFRSIPAAPLKLLDRSTTAWQWLHRWRPDVVLATGQKSVWLASWLCDVGRFRWVAIGHGTEFGFKTPWARRLTRWSFSRARAVVCVSEYTKKLMEEAGIQATASPVIANGADAERFGVLPTCESRQARERLGLTDAKILITVGNVTERKAQDVVIRAMPKLLRSVPNAHYLIVGLPTKKQEFSELARQLGVANHVHFLGVVDSAELVRLVNTSDVFVMTSRRTSDGDVEGYGIAAVEAALCGKPAVVSRNSGLAEAVADGSTGVCVPENDPEETADALAALLNDEPRLRGMGRAARTRALAEQTWERRVEEYDAVLRGIAQAPRHGQPSVRVAE